MEIDNDQVWILAFGIHHFQMVGRVILNAPCEPENVFVVRNVLTADQ